MKSTFIDKRLKTAILSLTMAFGVASCSSAQNKYEVKVQQPDVENTQVSTEDPWTQTVEFQNDIEALNKKFESKQVHRKAATNTGRVYSGTSAAKTVTKTLGNKRKSDIEKTVEVLSTGGRAVARDKQMTTGRDSRNALDQQRYNREYDNIVSKHKRRYQQEHKAEAKATGMDKVEQAYRKMYQDYLTECRKNKSPILYKTQSEYVQALESKASTQTQSSTLKAPKR